MISNYSLSLLPTSSQNAFAQFSSPKPKVLAAPVNPVKMETDSFASSANAKTAIAFAGSIIAAVAVGIGICSSLKKGNTDFINAKALQAKAADLLQEADAVKKTAAGVFEGAQKTYKEVLSRVNQGAKDGFKDVADESGNIIRRFRQVPDGGATERIMEELNPAGELTRVTSFDSVGSVINLIEEYSGGASTRIMGIRADVDGNLMDCIVGKGCTGLGDIFNVSEAYIRKGGLLSKYVKECTYDASNGCVSAKKGFQYQHAQLCAAHLDIENSFNKNIIGTSYVYKPSTGELLRANVGSEFNYDTKNGARILTSGKSDSQYGFGDVITVKKGVKMHPNAPETAESEIKFDLNGKNITNK